MQVGAGAVLRPSATTNPMVRWTTSTSAQAGVRDKYAATSLIPAYRQDLRKRRDRSNPFAMPPTCRWCKPQSPGCSRSAIGPRTPTVTSCMDTAAALCQEVRAHPETATADQVGAFIRRTATTRRGARFRMTAVTARARHHPQVRPTHAPGAMPAHPSSASRQAHGDRRH